MAAASSNREGCEQNPYFRQYAVVNTNELYNHKVEEMVNKVRISVLGYHTSLAIELIKVWELLPQVYEEEFSVNGGESGIILQKAVDLDFSVHVLDTPWEDRNRPFKLCRDSLPHLDLNAINDR